MFNLLKNVYKQINIVMLLQVIIYFLINLSKMEEKV